MSGALCTQPGDGPPWGLAVGIHLPTIVLSDRLRPEKIHVPNWGRIFPQVGSWPYSSTRGVTKVCNYRARNGYRIRVVTNRNYR
jgi:hypothetical protein